MSLPPSTGETGEYSKDEAAQMAHTARDCVAGSAWVSSTRSA